MKYVERQGTVFSTVHSNKQRTSQKNVLGYFPGAFFLLGKKHRIHSIYKIVVSIDT